MINKKSNYCRSIRQSKRFLVTNQLLFSPTSSSRNEIQHQPQGSIKPSPQLIRTPSNQNTLQNMKVKFLVNTLIKNMRYLSPPHIVPSNVQQQWQNTANQQQQQQTIQKKDQHSKQTLSQQLNHRYEFIRHINLLEGIVLVLFCWLITVSIVFQEKIGFYIFVIALILSSLRVVFLSLFAFKEKDNQNAGFIFNLFDDLIIPLILIITCILFMIRYSYDIGIITYFIQFIGLVTVVLQFKQIQNHFQNIVKYAQQNRMKKQLRIFQLFLLIITLAHIFGLIMHAMTHISPNDQTWLKKANLDQNQWHIQYIYCLYWAITTMVTVGYGDITPSNHYEVVVVMFIELTGTAVFGYMINVIGITVDQIKKKNQQFQNYQQTIDKLRDHYQLSRELCHKMKYDIKQKENQFKNIPLKTSQQKDFLQYIQPTLKQQFVLQTNMKVIKKCIFFLTHFSVNFQNQIALKLIRIIYKPDDLIQISDLQQQQRTLVIVNNGLVDIFIKKSHNNLSIAKKVREIKPSEDSLVMNVFGYSSLIVNRDIKLIAIARENAVSYVLRRKDFLQCIDKSMLDFQSFNQMREKITFHRNLEEVQAPSLMEKQKHYVPNIFIIQKKIKYENQSRLSYLRSNRKSKLKIVSIRSYGNKTIPKLPDQIGINSRQGQNFILQQQDLISMKSFHTFKQQSHTHNNNHNNHQNNNHKEKGIDKLRIDQCKVFENFMKGSNLPIVAAAYQKSCQKSTYRKRMRTSVLINKRGMFIQSMRRRKEKTFVQIY